MFASRICVGVSVGSASLCGIAYLGEKRWRAHAATSASAKQNAEVDSRIVPKAQRVYKSWDDDWDRRSPEAALEDSASTGDVLQGDFEQKHTAPTKSRHLILIRHGQYNLKTDKPEDKKLTALGRRQAQRTGERLRALKIPIDRLVNSGMVRAVETADLITAELVDSNRTTNYRRERDEMLNEGAPIEPEPPSSTWHPKSEFLQDGARIEAAFLKYFHRAEAAQKEDEYTVLVCHANVIRYFVCRALQFPPEGWLRISLPNGSITQMIIRPSGRVVLKNLGDSGHMDPDMVTFT